METEVLAKDDEHRRQIVARWRGAQARGETQAKFCAAHNLRPRTLREWCSRYDADRERVVKYAIALIRTTIDRLNDALVTLEMEASAQASSMPQRPPPGNADRQRNKVPTEAAPAAPCQSRETETESDMPRGNASPRGAIKTEAKSFWD